MNDVAGYSKEDEVDFIVNEAKKSFESKKNYSNRHPVETFNSLNTISIILL
jgi:hypothetical protein